MLDQRRRHCPNIVPALSECIVSTWMYLLIGLYHVLMSPVMLSLSFYHFASFCKRYNINDQWHGRIKSWCLTVWEGRGTMDRARRVADVAACRVVSNPAWCRIFQRNIMFLPSQCWDIVSMCIFLGKALYPHMLHVTQVYYA